MSPFELSTKAAIAKYGLHPQKKLGQNFLLDQNITDKIARTAGDLREATVIEIGPGPGGLTRSLLEAGAKEVFALEYDAKCCQALEELAEFYQPRLHVIHADALASDVSQLGTAPRQIVANLPYNISTELLFKWLAQIQSFTSLTLMFQREVAQRLTAQPKTSAYGRISVMTQWLTTVRHCFDLPPQAFFPPPKVTSSVVHITPRPAPLAPATWESLAAVTMAGFGQRRKMLRSSLKSLFGDQTEAILRNAAIESSKRAEELSVEDFCKLARAIQ